MASAAQVTASYDLLAIKPGSERVLQQVGQSWHRTLLLGAA